MVKLRRPRSCAAGGVRVRDGSRAPRMAQLTARLPPEEYTGDRPLSRRRRGRHARPSDTWLLPRLSVTGLTKRYGDRTVVDRLDVDLPSGVVAGFIGPNGAGKTTTMAMLLGLVRPTAGTGEVLGLPLDRTCCILAAGRRADREPRLLPVADRPGEPADVRGRRRPGLPPRSPICWTTVGLATRDDDRYRTYSLGMKQRLGIAAALLGDPDLLILDEPANGLDPQGVRDIRTLVGSLAGTGRTVLVSSHDLSELEQVCDWLVLIDGGRSLYQGPTHALLDGSGRGPRDHTGARRGPRCVVRTARTRRSSLRPR